MITRRLIDKIDNFKFRKEGQNMKLYISVDMEGLAGITHWKVKPRKESVSAKQ